MRKESDLDIPIALIPFGDKKEIPNKTDPSTEKTKKPANSI